MIPEEAEDLWHAYNLIMVGDTIRSTTIRSVFTVILDREMFTKYK